MVGNPANNTAYGGSIVSIYKSDAPAPFVDERSMVSEPIKFTSNFTDAIGAPVLASIEARSALTRQRNLGKLFQLVAIPLELSRRLFK